MKLGRPCYCIYTAGPLRSPEQVDADFGSRGPHSDVWGFAVCILHMATGQLPYAELGQIQMVSAMLKRRPPDVPASLPPWLQQTLKQCLSFDTAARPSVAALYQVVFSLACCIGASLGISKLVH